ncbi:MAG: tetratricopeptide repeat protein, partial [Candidatus Heimdallarchaeaceae archaeon]
MASDIPAEIKAHYNRISPELRDFFAQVVGPKFLPTNVTEIVKLLWNLIDDPVYEQDEELRYLASKIGVILGHYDLTIKCIKDYIPGTRVWGSVALFQIGEVDEAFSHLQYIIENETNDVLPLVEALVWMIYLKALIGESDNFENYKSQLENVLNSRKFQLIPQQIRHLKIFAEALFDIYSMSNIKGIQKIREFTELRKKEGDQFWQLMGLLSLGDYVLDSSNYSLAEIIYKEALNFAKNLNNVPLIAACRIGLADAYCIRGNLKAGNLLVAQTIEEVKGKSMFYLANAFFVRGKILTKMGQHPNARNHFERAKKLFMQYHDYHRGFRALIAVADSYLYLNEYDKASKIYEEAYTQIVNISNKKQFVKALVEIVNGLYRQGKYSEALKRINQIETLSEEIVYQKGKTDALKLRAKLYIAQNKNVEEQIFLLQSCQILYAEIGDEGNIADCSLLLGEIYTLLNMPKIATKYIEEAKVFYLKVNDTMKIAEIKELQANFDITDGKFDEALVKLRSSYNHYSAIFDTNHRARCLRKIGDILAIKGNLDDGLDRYNKVLTLRENTPNELEVVTLTLNKARIYTALQNYDKALECYKEAEHFFIENDIQDGLEMVTIERTYVYLLMGEKERLSDLLASIKNDTADFSPSFQCWLKFVEAAQLSASHDHSEIYSLLAECFSDATSKNKYAAVAIIIYLIDLLTDLFNEDNSNQFIAEEINNYLSLGFSLCSEMSYYYLKASFYLLIIAWKEMTNQADAMIVLSEAAEYFTVSGFDRLGTTLLNIQYNMN